MISTLKKHILMLSLVTGVVAPLSAMDQSESSSIFGWKTAACVAVVGAGALYWLVTLEDKPVVSPLPPAQFEPRLAEGEQPGRKVQVTTQPEPVHQVTKSVSPQPKKPVKATKEIIILAESDEVVRFRAASPMNQKIELARVLDIFVDVPTQAGEDLITQYAQIYDLRLKSSMLSILANKLFAAKATGPSGRQEAVNQIKRHLGLISF